MEAFSTIDQYINQFSPEVQLILQKIKTIIKEEAPQAIEKISYAMPTFYLNGNLVHFAAYKSHIGFYPAPSGLEAFKEQIGDYKNSKGAVQFPINKPIPYELIRGIVRFRVNENCQLTRK